MGRKIKFNLEGQVTAGQCKSRQEKAVWFFKKIVKITKEMNV